MLKPSDQPRLLALCLILCFAASGCSNAVRSTDDLSQAVKTAQPLNNDPRNFQFAIMADREGGGRPGVFEDAVSKVNLLQPEFVLCVGDLIAGYTERRGNTDQQAELNRQWDEFNPIVAKLQMPFFYLPGNHDISNALQADDYQRRFGRSWYHFRYRDVLFLCLNTEDPPASQFSAEQIAFVSDTLAKNADVRWTFVFLHKPMWIEESGKKAWEQVEGFLQNRPCTVFGGHQHTYRKTERNGQKYFLLATTGGASGLAGPQAGQFDHVVWVTMTDQGPVLANLLLGGILDEDLRGAQEAKEGK